jgi:ATP-dependent RNA helicase DeaD
MNAVHNCESSKNFGNLRRVAEGGQQGYEPRVPFPIANIALQQALSARSYTTPTPVQQAVLESDAGNRDLLVSAQTGSGKTVAYGLALAPTILGDADTLPPPGPPMVLVVTPTRELAIQVHAELSWLYEAARGRVISCVGGMDPRREQRALAAGCHIVVGTPGRLQDHIQRGNLNLSKCRAVVLDEADEMLDLGFREELEFILQAAPPERRTLLFSATIPKEIVTLARKYQRDALRIDTGGRGQPHKDIEYRAVLIAGHETEHSLVNLLRYYDARCLVFCATREAVRRLHGRLQERGFSAVALSGELSQHERNTALQSLRDGRARVCIATDVAARGLDLPDLDLVIHADLPTNKETLLHRSGRTGRAGRKGICLLLVPSSKRRRAELLLTAANITATWEDPPQAEEIRRRDQERLLADPALTQPPLEEERVLAKALLERQTPEMIATALIRVFQSSLPEPEEITLQKPPPEAPRPKRPSPRPVDFGQADNAEMVWFRSPVGRKNNADPKWLIPIICRIGGITKQEIGAIRIFDRETKFEIAGYAAERFAAAAAPNSDLAVTRTTAPSVHKPPREKAAIHAPAGRAREQARRKKNRANWLKTG